ncbi:MAG: SLC45 family MFS transporter [Ruminococcaceae bacterium]|nr:SLC45 family MFS transporter [Oscillospiraceae bacterium]
MKLNYKRVIFVGFAFFLISAFWQAYDTIIPKILTDKFGLSQAISGAIMALDNIFALVLLPVFGALSDKVSSRFGRRTPFIVVGAVCAAVLLVTLSLPDRAQLRNIEAATATEGEAYTESLGAIWDENPSVHDWRSEDLLAGKKPLQELIGRDEFTSIPMTVTEENGTSKTNPEYSNVVVPARQAYAARMTAQNGAPLVVFMILLFLTLVAMGTFRSPAVALMPDVTVKPLRSKANAVINLMGTAGGILVLLLGTVFGTGKTVNALMSYTTFFSIVAGIMMVGLAVFVWKVREPQWAADMQEESERLGIDAPAESAEQTEVRTLSRAERISLLLILASVVFWFMGYNAVTSKYSVYASTVLNVDYNTTLLIAQAAAIVAYLPVGMLSSRLGRKKMILGGVVILATSFFFASFLSAESPELVKQLLMPLLFALAGIGWATINVNSYPMVVELSRGSNVGKYTGFYYTASMSAQVVTPILSGAFLDLNFRTLFPYATVFVVLAFVTMLFVKHGDSRPEAKEVILDAVGGDD